MPSPINTPPIYQNPFMAPNGFSGIHLNSFMTDTGAVKGPASTTKPSVQQKSITPPGIAATIAFNAKGQVVTIHIGSSDPDTPDGAPTIMLIDPTTLDTLSSIPLPARPKPPPHSKISFAGGYFYLDQKFQVVCVVTSQNPTVQQIRKYSTSNNTLTLLLPPIDLSGAINDSYDVLNSVLPDSYGNIWYITQKGRVGYVDTQGVLSRVVTLNSPISKSFASDGEGNVYVVTDSPTPPFTPTTPPTPPPPAAPGALYCLRAQLKYDQAQVVWRAGYDSGSSEIKPGQNQVGCGTTPTCFNDFQGKRFVAITDNAPNMSVNVYLRDSGKLVAKQPVFTAQGASNACENSLIAVNRSIIVENNYDNSEIESTDGPKTTTPGINRVDFNPDTETSSVVWANNSIAVPSVVSQLSTGDGMLYTYAKAPPIPTQNDPGGWHWAALDFADGKLVKKSPYINFTNPAVAEASNNWYAGLTIGPNGAAYLSVFGGLTVWRPGS